MLKLFSNFVQALIELFLEWFDRLMLMKLDPIPEESSFIEQDVDMRSQFLKPLSQSERLMVHEALKESVKKTMIGQDEAALCKSHTNNVH